MADDEVGERRDATERRVYNLPAALVQKLRAYQTSQNISSETEAARRLIEAALQARETVFDILLSVETALSENPDLRIIASDLMRHSQIGSTKLESGDLLFSMNNDHSGKVSASPRGGYNLYYSFENWQADNWSNFDYWKRENIAPQKRTPAKTSPGGWEPSNSDLDDEIPF